MRIRSFNLAIIVGAVAGMLLDTPRLAYMHFWAVDEPTKLAGALKTALDRTNSRS